MIISLLSFVVLLCYAISRTRHYLIAAAMTLVDHGAGDLRRDPHLTRRRTLI